MAKAGTCVRHPDNAGHVGLFHKTGKQLTNRISTGSMTTTSNRLRSANGDVMRGRRVLIVGAGIAGLAMARTLARIGACPEVIERERVWRCAGTGMYLPGNATRALRALGLDAHLAGRSVEISRQRFCDHRGRLLREVDVAALWRLVGPCLAMHRADLHELLLEAIGDLPIRFGQTVDRITQRDGSVSVECSDGTSGDYDLVVAADGINSAIRRLVFEPTAVPHAVGQVGWRFVAARPPEVTTWSVMLGRRTAFLTLPIADDRVYCYGDTHSARDPDSADCAPAERLTRLFSGFADPAATLLAALDAAHEIHTSTIEEVVLDSWVRDRVVLVGDAAHAMSPNMAQGAAMALEDALVLARCLHDIEPIPYALATFEARRRPRTDWVRAQTHRRDHTRYLPPIVRDNVLRVFGRSIMHANYRPVLDEP